MKIEKIAMIGAGAIGCVYAYPIYKTYKDNFAFIANGSRREKLEREGIYLNGEKFNPKVISSDDDFKPDLIILAIKNYQLDDAIEDIKNLVGENTIILPLLNGIVAKDILQEAFKDNHVLYGIAMRIDAVKEGNRVTNSLEGVIQFGDAENLHMSEAVLAVKNALNEAGVNNQVFDNMIKTVWNKWMLNIGINQVSAVANACYGVVVKTPELMNLFEKAMREVVEVSQAVGINLEEENIQKAKDIMKSLEYDKKTSMLQDVQNKRKTEVDYFSGTLIKIAKENNIQTPVNEVLYDLIKSIEKNY